MHDPACSDENSSRDPQRPEADGMAASSPATPESRTGNAGRESLVFKIGSEEYGIDILNVREIRSCERSPRIANAPEFVMGAVNLRGAILKHAPDRQARVDVPMAASIKSGYRWARAGIFSLNIRHVVMASGLTHGKATRM